MSQAATSSSRGEEPKDSPITTNKRTLDNDQDDDGNTTPPSKTLKHTTIDDDVSQKGSSPSSHHPRPSIESIATESKSQTPEPTNRDDSAMPDRIASPKKKRGREHEDDESKSTDNKQETTVKRPRDASQVRRSFEDDPGLNSPSTIPANGGKAATTKSTPVSDSRKENTATVTAPAPAPAPQTSASAFANSGFGSIANAPSGFAALAGKPSVFGGGAALKSSSFASNPQSVSDLSAPKPLLSFAGPVPKSAKDTATASGFGGLAAAKGGFAGGFGGGFGSGFAAPAGKLSTFAAPDKHAAPLAGKPIKAFGAPESDGEDASEDDTSENDNASDDEAAATLPEDKKKVKLAKGPIDDGEAGETTLLQFRAKLFRIESQASGWKERGVGTLKLLVPKSYVDYDFDGQPILGSYDPSGREESVTPNDTPEATAARLVMRQENTHRVILNTPIIKAMKFEQKPSNSAVQILFTALEEGRLVNMLLKMSETNAKAFSAEISTIQREL